MSANAPYAMIELGEAREITNYINFGQFWQGQLISNQVLR
jgi:hypothetical protein